MRSDYLPPPLKQAIELFHGLRNQPSHADIKEYIRREVFTLKQAYDSLPRDVRARTSQADFVAAWIDNKYPKDPMTDAIAGFILSYAATKVLDAALNAL